MIRLLLVEDDNNLSYIVQTGLQDIIGGYEVIMPATEKKVWKPGKNITLTSLFQTSTCP